MIEVLLVSVAPASAGSLAATARRFEGPDVRLRLATFSGPAELPDSPLLAERHAFAQEASLLGRKAATAAERAPAARRAWMHAQRDPWLRARGRDADVLVALDDDAVYTVWQLARVNSGADACYGAAAGMRAVSGRLAPAVHEARTSTASVLPVPATAGRTAGHRTTRHLKSLILVPVGPRVLRTRLGAIAWRTLVAAPGLPERARSRLAVRVAEGLRKADRPADAVHILNTAAERTRGLRRRADLLAAAARLDLGRGRVPVRLAAAIAAEVACADEAWSRGKGVVAAESITRAMDLAFHRVLHFDRVESPMADDPEAYLAPLHTSATLAAVSRWSGRIQPAAPPPTGRPPRLLFVTHRNSNFLTEIRTRYELDPAVEVRSLDIGTVPALEGLTRTRARMAAFRLGSDPELGRLAEEHLRPHLDWADTVFIDWCTRAAVLLTAIDPGTARLVLRLHSFEAFSAWPFLTDFSRVDDVVFVAAHLRDLTVSVVPSLRRPDAPRLHVIANAMDLERFERPKEEGARFTLGLIGIAAVAKDTRWAIDVLARLRGIDDRYRLLLIGSDVDGSLSPAAREYALQYRQEIAPLEALGAVRRLGQVSDVPAALSGIGVILSSSVRESFHCGFVEGAASGAVPVARDWPFFADKPNGAHTLFPSSWLVHTPQEAADRIIATTATEEAWTVAGRDAADHARATWGWPTLSREFDHLLLDDPGAPPADGASDARPARRP